MHAVHGDELLGQRVRDALVVDARAWDSGDGFTRPGDTSNHFGEFLTDDSPPICVHADLKGRVSQNCRRPLDRVDLGHQSAVHDACLVEDLVSAPRCQLRESIPNTKLLTLSSPDALHEFCRRWHCVREQRAYGASRRRATNCPKSLSLVCHLHCWAGIELLCQLSPALASRGGRLLSSSV